MSALHTYVFVLHWGWWTSGPGSGWVTDTSEERERAYSGEDALLQLKIRLDANIITQHKQYTVMRMYTHEEP